jgi:hypothetical protein
MNEKHQEHETVTDDLNANAQSTHKPAYSKPVLHILSTSDTRTGSEISNDSSTLS